MRLATVRTADGLRAGVVVGEDIALLPEPDVRAVLATWSIGVPPSPAAGAPRVPLATAVLAPIVPAPDKILCVGLNYRAHIDEMRRGFPEHPSIFTKFASTLIGPNDPIALPPESSSVDWEVELAIVIGCHVRRARGRVALEAIAGFTVMNDTSMRDWQHRSPQVLPGKAWDASTPLGPVLVSRDEIGDGSGLELWTTVDGVEMQRSTTSDLLFGPVELVEYVSTFTSLAPGDVIATGTPAGVGAGRTPPVFLRAGNVVRTGIVGIGVLVNECREEVA